MDGGGPSWMGIVVVKNSDGLAAKRVDCRKSQRKKGKTRGRRRNHVTNSGGLLVINPWPIGYSVSVRQRKRLNH